MCGRFVTPGDLDIERLWHVRGGEPFGPRFNVAPTTMIPMFYIDRHDAGRSLALARWGLIPFWAKGPKPPSHTFNTRLEDAPTKPMWRKPFRESRCIIPAIGWYEWKLAEAVETVTGEVTSYKQPYFMHRPSREPIGFAGVMSWTKPEGSEAWMPSCSILTTAATGVAAEVHHRMPVALPAESFDAWMDPARVNADAVNALIADVRLALDIAKHAVSTRVNSSRTEDRTLIEPINPE